MGGDRVRGDGAWEGGRAAARDGRRRRGGAEAGDDVEEGRVAEGREAWHARHEAGHSAGDGAGPRMPPTLVFYQATLGTLNKNTSKKTEEQQATHTKETGPTLEKGSTRPHRNEEKAKLLVSEGRPTAE